MNSDEILAASPWIEVFVRNIYWRFRFVNGLLAKRSNRASKTFAAQPRSVDVAIPFEEVCNQLARLGVKSGDVMIVHSSGVALRPTGLKPKEICERLLEFLSPSGTLALPAIPFFAEEPTGLDRLSDAICEQRLLYDVRKTRAWTGALPKAMLAFPNAVRSRHPLNSMVAIGPLASKMMESNLHGDRPMACGPDSSWKFCADQNAHIVCLGVDTAHSLTMIHVAEDSWADSWPIGNWYRDRQFRIVDGDYEADITVRERRPKWAMYYGERTLQKDLIHAGILKIVFVEGLRIEVCRSAELIDFLNSRKGSGYPYWVPFWVKN